MRIINLLMIIGLSPLGYCYDGNGQNLKINLVTPTTFKETKDLECSSTEFLRGWYHNGITPDSADFRTRDGKVYRVITNGDNASIYAMDRSCRKGASLLSFSSSRKIGSIKDSPLSPLICGDRTPGSYHLFPYPQQVPEDLKIYESIWLSQTLRSNKIGAYHGNVISVLIDPKGECQFGFIDKNKNRHRNEFYDGIKYQQEYHLGDTVFLEGTHYKISSMDNDFSSVLLKPIQVGRRMEQLPSAVFSKVSSFFKKNKLLLIDIWGTWCQPCIQGLPQLEKIRTENTYWLSVLSICQDMPKNKKRALDLFRKDNIKVPLLNNVTMDRTVTEELKVNAYPTYIVINDRGEIIFKLVGEKMLIERIEALKYARRYSNNNL